MQPRALKYVLDIESLVQEIDSFKQLVGNPHYRDFYSIITVSGQQQRGVTPL